jgi:flagellar biosynthetic protein FliQ
MSTSVVMDIARHGMTVALMVTLPVLAVALFTGLLVSVLQAVTQIQEMTLTFVPKLIGAALVLIGLGGWMLTTLVRFVTLCFEHAGRVGL